MDLEDDTTVLTTLKSFNSFISQTEPPQRLSENSVASGNLQSQYKRSMEVGMHHLTAPAAQLLLQAVLICRLCTDFVIYVVVVGGSRKAPFKESLPSIEPGEEANGAESQAGSI